MRRTKILAMAKSAGDELINAGDNRSTVSHPSIIAGET
jgi:hypothetical protein